MSNRTAHIAATEGHTLCGLRVTRTILTPEPWTTWITTYQGNPSACCPRCRRICLRSADRTMAIRSADQEYRLKHRNPADDSHAD